MGARFSAPVCSEFGVKRPGRGADHSPTTGVEVKETVEPYTHSPSGPSWPVLGWPLPLPSLRSSCNVTDVSVKSLTNLELFQQILIIKATNTKFHKYRSRGSRAMIRALRRTRRHDEAKRWFFSLLMRICLKKGHNAFEAMRKEFNTWEAWIFSTNKLRTHQNSISTQRKMLIARCAT